MEWRRKGGPLTNAHIAELLALASQEAHAAVQKAFRRAARSAFLWPEEATWVLLAGRSLTELRSVGPYLEKQIRHWIENPPVVEEPPEIRRGFLTVPQARTALASRPAWRKALQGDLQMHTTWSDGSGSILEMAHAAEACEYAYIAITDHSKGLKIAGGINENELVQQGEEIDRVNESLAKAGSRVRVLRSVEMNLNPRGEGDMEPSALARLDLVLGSFHSALRKTEDQTERYLAALRDPSIQILGHPRCRVYNYRLGLTADWPRVFATAAELGKAVEIDAYPDRQDLNLELVKQATKAGCLISLGTDAHHPWQLEFMDLGLATAMLAGVKREKILNFMSHDKLLAWVAATRVRSTKKQSKREKISIG
jgi:histidinol phosphatase-like PHP family hydrolase